MKENDLLILEAAAPEELRVAIDSLAEKQDKELRLAQLNLIRPGILVRQFKLPLLSGREVRAALKLDAAEILSLSPEEIELDYRILSVSEDKIKGCFLAISGAVLQAYLATFEHTDIIPVKLTAKILVVVGEFLLKQPGLKENFCLLDFTKAGNINLAVFIYGQCELLREVYYESDADAEEEVINSLKYACGHSAGKKLNAFYFSGDTSGKEALVARLEKEIEVEEGPQDFINNPASALHADAFLGMNLFKGHAVSLSLRNWLLRGESLLLALCLLACFILGIQSTKRTLALKQLRSSFSQADYDYARSLKEKIELLK